MRGPWQTAAQILRPRPHRDPNDEFDCLALFDGGWGPKCHTPFYAEVEYALGVLARQLRLGAARRGCGASATWV
jgi:hypothetical protein